MEALNFLADIFGAADGQVLGKHASQMEILIHASAVMFVLLRTAAVTDDFFICIQAAAHQISIRILAHPFDGHRTLLSGNRAVDLHIAVLEVGDADLQLFAVDIALQRVISADRCLPAACIAADGRIGIIAILKRNTVEDEVLIRAVDDAKLSEISLIIDRVAAQIVSVHRQLSGQSIAQVLDCDRGIIGDVLADFFLRDAHSTYACTVGDIDDDTARSVADMEVCVGRNIGRSTGGERNRFVVVRRSDAGALSMRPGLVFSFVLHRVNQHVGADQICAGLDRNVCRCAALDIRFSVCIADASGSGIRFSPEVAVASVARIAVRHNLQRVITDDQCIVCPHISIQIRGNMGSGVNVDAQSLAVGMRSAVDTQLADFRQNTDIPAGNLCRSAAFLSDIHRGIQIDRLIAVSNRMVADGRVVDVGIRFKTDRAGIRKDLQRAEGVGHLRAALNVHSRIGGHIGRSRCLAQCNESRVVRFGSRRDAVAFARICRNSQVSEISFKLCAAADHNLDVARQVVFRLDCAAVDETALGIRQSLCRHDCVGMRLKLQVVRRIQLGIAIDLDLIVRIDGVAAKHVVGIQAKRNAAAGDVRRCTGHILGLDRNALGMDLRSAANRSFCGVLAVRGNLGIADVSDRVAGFFVQHRLGVAAVFGIDIHAAVFVAVRVCVQFSICADRSLDSLSVFDAVLGITHLSINVRLAAVDHSQFARRFAVSRRIGIAHRFDVNVSGRVDLRIADRGFDGLCRSGIGFEVASRVKRHTERRLRISIGIASDNLCLHADALSIEFRVLRAGDGRLVHNAGIALGKVGIALDKGNRSSVARSADIGRRIRAAHNTFNDCRLLEVDRAGIVDLCFLLGAVGGNRAVERSLRDAQAAVRRLGVGRGRDAARRHLDAQAVCFDLAAAADCGLRLSVCIADRLIVLSVDNTNVHRAADAGFGICVHGVIAVQLDAARLHGCAGAVKSSLKFALGIGRRLHHGSVDQSDAGRRRHDVGVRLGLRVHLDIELSAQVRSGLVKICLDRCVGVRRGFGIISSDKAEVRAAAGIAADSRIRRNSSVVVEVRLDVHGRTLRGDALHVGPLLHARVGSRLIDACADNVCIELRALDRRFRLCVAVGQHVDAVGVHSAAAAHEGICLRVGRRIGAVGLHAGQLDRNMRRAANRFGFGDVIALDEDRVRLNGAVGEELCVERSGCLRVHIGDRRLGSCDAHIGTQHVRLRVCMRVGDQLNCTLDRGIGAAEDRLNFRGDLRVGRAGICRSETQFRAAAVVVANLSLCAGRTVLVVEIGFDVNALGFNAHAVDASGLLGADGRIGIKDADVHNTGAERRLVDRRIRGRRGVCQHGDRSNAVHHSAGDNQLAAALRRRLDGGIGLRIGHVGRRRVRGKAAVRLLGHRIRINRGIGGHVHRARLDAVRAGAAGDLRNEGAVGVGIDDIGHCTDQSRAERFLHHARVGKRLRVGCDGKRTGNRRVRRSKDCGRAAGNVGVCRIALCLAYSDAQAFLASACHAHSRVCTMAAGVVKAAVDGHAVCVNRLFALLHANSLVRVHVCHDNVRANLHNARINAARADSGGRICDRRRRQSERSCHSQCAGSFDVRACVRRRICVSGIYVGRVHGERTVGLLGYSVCVHRQVGGHIRAADSRIAGADSSGEYAVGIGINDSDNRFIETHVQARRIHKRLCDGGRIGIHAERIADRTVGRK